MLLIVCTVSRSDGRKIQCKLSNVEGSSKLIKQISQKSTIPKCTPSRTNYADQIRASANLAWVANKTRGSEGSGLNGSPTLSALSLIDEIACTTRRAPWQQPRSKGGNERAERLRERNAKWTGRKTFSGEISPRGFTSQRDDRDSHLSTSLLASLKDDKVRRNEIRFLQIPNPNLVAQR